jgi:hypothetical protein
VFQRLPLPSTCVLPCARRWLGQQQHAPFAAHAHAHTHARAQILGAIFGSLIYAGLIPGLRVGATYFTGESAPGCFGPAPGVHNAELFWWEVSPRVREGLRAHARAALTRWQRQRLLARRDAVRAGTCDALAPHCRSS